VVRKNNLCITERLLMKILLAAEVYLVGLQIAVWILHLGLVGVGGLKVVTDSFITDILRDFCEPRLVINCFLTNKLVSQLFRCWMSRALLAVGDALIVSPADHSTPLSKNLGLLRCWVDLGLHHLSRSTLGILSILVGGGVAFPGILGSEIWGKRRWKRSWQIEPLVGKGRTAINGDPQLGSKPCAGGQVGPGRIVVQWRGRSHLGSCALPQQRCNGTMVCCPKWLHMIRAGVLGRIG